jgi:hypothetical protein
VIGGAIAIASKVGSSLEFRLIRSPQIALTNLSSLTEWGI